MKDQARILVVDDKVNMVRMLAKLLGETYSVQTCSNGSQALVRVASENFDVVLSDIRMPGADGLEVLRAVKQQSPDTEVILMTAYASIEKAVETIRDGAYDYVQKPFEPDEVLLTVARACERKRLKDQAADLKRQLEVLKGPRTIIGNSPAIRDIYAQIEQASKLDITVLVTGESGTGKELVAQAIHERSARREGPFVPVNCGALPDDLVESEMFGYARGAFTGAGNAKQGLFEAADGGTLLLDEIGDLPLPAQVKLTRVLQEREIRPVGSTHSRRIDVRVIAATLRDLRGDVRDGRFREDLFYRLNVFPIRVPPLRERQEDIPLLVAHFLARYTKQLGREINGIESEALQALVRYPWPGNVRELANTIERLVAVSSRETIDRASLPQEILADPNLSSPGDLLAQLPFREAMDMAREHASREYLTTIMKRFQGHVTRAAEHAGIERESLHRLLKKHGLRSDNFK